MKESEEVYKNSKGYIWIVKIETNKNIIEMETNENVDYGTAISLEDNMILMPCLYFDDDEKYTITGRRLSEKGFRRKLSIVFSQRWLGLTMLEEEKGLGWVSGNYATLANDGSLGYAETLYTTGIYERMVAYFSTGNAAFPCLDLGDLPDISESEGLTCGDHVVVGYDDFTESSPYRTIGDIFNIKSICARDPSENWTDEGKLHSSLPIVHCNGFSRFGEGTSGAPILNINEEIVGMRIMSWTSFGIALHVSVIRLFIKQYRKYRKDIEGKRKRESVESGEPAKKKKESKKEEERRKKEDRRKKRQRQKERKKERRNNKSGENVVTNMSQIDPSQHSHAYLYILEDCTSGPLIKKKTSNFILPKFLIECHAPQIHLAPKTFICDYTKFKDYVGQLGAPICGVGPLLMAVNDLQSSTEDLTTLHADILQLCLLTICHETGFHIFKDDIFEVDQPKDLYLYRYYGGMTCIGLKRYPKALELLHNVETASASSLSALAVEAYREYILVSLSHLGQFSMSFPEYTSAAAQRALKNISQLYVELVSYYRKAKVSQREDYNDANKEDLESDDNLGLVKQILLSMYKRNVQRLTQTYLALAIEGKAKTVELSGPKEAETHVLQMIEDGEKYLAIKQKDGMVRFLADSEQY